MARATSPTRMGGATDSARSDAAQEPSELQPSSENDGKSAASATGTLAEDEYPAQPTLFYFLLKFALGALTLLVLVVAYWFRPYTCEGVCSVDQSVTVKCGPLGAPKFLFYHQLPFGADENLVNGLDSASRRKGFNLVTLPETATPTAHLPTISRESLALADTLEHMPWQLAVRGNHSLFIKPRLGSVVWSDLGLASTRSVFVLRNPLDRLKEWYEGTVRDISPSLFSKATLLQKDQTLFETCVLDPKCRSAMGLRTVCQEQTRLVCGLACVGDETSSQDRVSRAKAVLSSKQALVGFAEDLAALSAVLRRKLPTFFEFTSATTTSTSVGMEDWSSEVQDVLQDLCGEDLAVYAEAIRVFGEIAEECDVKDVHVPPVVERVRKESARGFLFMSW